MQFRPGLYLISKAIANCGYVFDRATYHFAALSLLFVFAMSIGQFVVSQSGKHDPGDIYILVSSPFATDLPADVIDAGGYRIEPVRALLSVFIFLPESGHAQVVAAGHTLVSASRLATLCGLSSKDALT